jgi:hypothetical protein
VWFCPPPPPRSPKIVVNVFCWKRSLICFIMLSVQRRTTVTAGICIKARMTDLFTRGMIAVGGVHGRYTEFVWQTCMGAVRIFFFQRRTRCLTTNLLLSRLKVFLLITLVKHSGCANEFVYISNINVMYISFLFFFFFFQFSSPPPPQRKIMLGRFLACIPRQHPWTHVELQIWLTVFLPRK